jgi:lipopolysaccharide assembly outer membrane protein LptD (OstA)
MNKLLRILGMMFIMGIIITVGCFGGWWDGFFPKPALKPVPKPALPGLVMNRTELDGWDNGQKVWLIKARKIWQSDDSNIIYFEKISDGVIFSVKDRRVDFSAGWARWEKLRNELYIGGNIKAQITEGTLTTPEAVMNFFNHELSCRQGIRFKGDNLAIKASQVRLNFDKEELYLEGGVELDQKENQIKSGALIYNLKDEQYRLEKPEGVILEL